MAERDPVTGRFVSTRNMAESGEGKFETYTEMPVSIQGADPADLAYATVPRHAPAGDWLAGSGPSYGSARLRPRTQRLVSQAGRDVLEQHAKPDRSTLHADAMREAAGPDAGDLDPVRYLVGDIDGSE